MASVVSRMMASLLLIMFCVSLDAMELNLARPWGENCSPPQNPYIAVFCPTSDTFLFDKGNQIEFVVQAGLHTPFLNWTLARNGLQKPFREGKGIGMMANRFKIVLETKGLKPGFYDLKITLDTGVPTNQKRGLEARPLSSICTFGWKVDEMKLPKSRPADFNAFWDKAIAEVNTISLDAKNETEMKTYDKKAINDYNVKEACLPPDYDPEGHKVETVESCKVSFAGPKGPAGDRVYGWLAKPLGKGPFPAMLVLPGAGFAARPRPLEHARHGYLALDIQIHGQDVDQKKYDKLPSHTADETDPNKHYYKKVYQRVIQAINYLASRSDVDKDRIVVVGGSQGGRLSTVAAGLDKRVAAAVPSIAHFGNIPYVYWVQWCNGIRKDGEKPWGKKARNREKSDGMDMDTPPVLIEGLFSPTEAYYDIMNFAPDVKCPIRFVAGLNDPISMPSGVWAAYNLVPGDKEIHPMPGHGHDWWAEHDRRAWKWLDEKLNKK